MAKPTEYRVIDDRIKPDLRGEMGGVRMYSRDGQRYVAMTAEQARYFLEQGAIAKAEAAPKAKK